MVDDDLIFGFGAEANSFLSAKNEMVNLAKQLKDTALEEELKTLFAAHTVLEQRFQALLQSDQPARPGGPFLD